MTLIARASLVVLSLAAIAAGQDKDKEIDVVAQNTEQGVEIRAPISGGKDQMWVAKVKEGKFYKEPAVSVSHRVDNFCIEVYASRLDDPMRQKWPDKVTEVAKNQRDNFVKNEDGKPAQWKECRVIQEDPKAKLPQLSGKCCMHKIALVDEKDQKREIIQYFCISSEVLYVVTVTYDNDSFKKYWPREGQQILASIKRHKYIPAKK